MWDNTSYHRENLDPTSILRHILPLSSRGGAGFLRSLCTYQHRTSKYYNLTFARLKQRNIILDTCHASPACKTPVPRKNSNFLLLTCKERQVSPPPCFLLLSYKQKRIQRRIALLKISLERISQAAIAQLGERQTEDLKVAGSIPACGDGDIFCFQIQYILRPFTSLKIIITLTTSPA